MTNTSIQRILLYGIKNCDTVKKSRNWLDTHHISYQFMDFRQQSLEPETLLRWCNHLGLKQLINKKSTSWRQLSTASQVLLEQKESAIPLLIITPTLIKRPLVEIHHLDGKVDYLQGFNQQQFVTTLLES